MGVGWKSKVNGIWGGTTDSKGFLRSYMENCYCIVFLKYMSSKRNFKGVTIRGHTPPTGHYMILRVRHPIPGTAYTFLCS